MLSDSERKYIKGELNPPVSYRTQLDLRIRNKAKKALEDLMLIAEKHNSKQWRKIFTLSKVIPFTQALLWRDFTHESIFKPKAYTDDNRVKRWTDRSEQWYLAWVIREITTKRILQGTFYFPDEKTFLQWYNQIQKLFSPLGWVEDSEDLKILGEKLKNIRKQFNL